MSNPKNHFDFIIIIISKHSQIIYSLSHTHTDHNGKISLLHHNPNSHLLISLSTPNPTPLLIAHSVLTHHNFPIKLLPTTVNSYTLNHTFGEFIVDLTNQCRLLLPPDNYLATYSKKVTGKIVENRIKELSGIRVRAFYQWWGIIGIKISGDDLLFEVGMVTAKYPSKNFVQVPICEGKKHSSS